MAVNVPTTKRSASPGGDLDQHNEPIRKSLDGRRRDREEKPEREECRKGGIRIDPSGYDAGKKVTGKKRHILVDTLGLLLHAIVHPADIQDRDGGALLLSTLFGMYPFLAKLFADAGYQGPQFAEAVAKCLPHRATAVGKS